MRSGHFPLMHFWGPLANIKSTDWIVDSAVDRREEVPAAVQLHLLAASRLRRAEVRPGQPAGAAAALGELDCGDRPLIDGYAGGGNGRSAVAGRERVRDHTR